MFGPATPAVRTSAMELNKGSASGLLLTVTSFGFGVSSDRTTLRIYHSTDNLGWMFFLASVLHRSKGQACNLA